jgi:hypothetical protein
VKVDRVCNLSDAHLQILLACVPHSEAVLVDSMCGRQRLYRNSEPGKHQHRRISALKAPSCTPSQGNEHVLRVRTFKLSNSQRRRPPWEQHPLSRTENLHKPMDPPPTCSVVTSVHRPCLIISAVGMTLACLAVKAAAMEASPRRTMLGSPSSFSLASCSCSFSCCRASFSCRAFNRAAPGDSSGPASFAWRKVKGSLSLGN